jgi:hypothetical protein
MPITDKTATASDAAAVLVPHSTDKKPVPIWIARDAGWAGQAPLTPMQ